MIALFLSLVKRKAKMSLILSIILSYLYYIINNTDCNSSYANFMLSLPQICTAINLLRKVNRIFENNSANFEG